MFTCSEYVLYFLSAGHYLVEYGVGGFELAEQRKLFHTFSRQYGDDIGVALESGAFCLKAVGADHVDVLFHQFRRRVLEQVLRLHRESAEELAFLTVSAEISEDVLRWLEFYTASGRGITLLDLFGRDFCRSVICNGRGLYDYIHPL